MTHTNKIMNEDEFCIVRSYESLQNNYNRLQQELSELQKLKDEDSLRVAELVTENVRLNKDWLKERQENAEFAIENYKLDETNRRLRAVIDDGREENKRFREENEKLIRENIELQITLNEFDRFNKFCTALEEIREIAKNSTKKEDYLIGQEYTDLVDEIHNKINEVLG